MNTGFTVMIVVNFVSILALYGLMLYILSKYISIEFKVNSLLDYKTINERQLKNLVKDINKNDDILSNTHIHY
jgi:hypothetical protein